MTTKELQKQDKREVNSTAAESLTDSGVAFAPEIDIFSNEEELILAVDLPGVNKGDVKLEIDENDTLNIRAKNSYKESANAIFRQYNVGDYYRSFRISKDYNKEKVHVTFDNGELIVRIPKREEAKPKKIEINA